MPEKCNLNIMELNWRWLLKLRYDLWIGSKGLPCHELEHEL